MKKTTGRGWIMFTLFTLLYITWVVWMQNFWLALGELLIIDIYFTRLIPYDFWKKSKNPLFRKIMEWIDAIGFALIAVYFINTFLFQNYQIPTSSLEKSLLVGDYLFVSKMTYGPRVPNTPLSFPLAQHTLPILDCKSYIEWPQWPYKRLKGLRKIERNDIVVFNFPAGDTVALKAQQTDYYTLCAFFGREAVNNDNSVYGDIVYRPVDRRENYVKRCIGLPGETLQIIDRKVHIDGKPLQEPEHVQFNYLVETNGTMLTEEIFRELGVSKEDRQWRVGNSRVLYSMPLTKDAVAKLKRMNFVTNVVVTPQDKDYRYSYPNTINNGWNVDNYGPLWIPKKGATLQLTTENIPYYERVIRNYEGNEISIKGDKIFINNEPATSYTFKMDYYWMMGDNRHNSADSRSWGFVPEDHIVGTPVLVWLSIDKDRDFLGKIRFNRLFRTVKALSESEK